MLVTTLTEALTVADAMGGDSRERPALRVVWPPHVDYLRAVATVTAEAAGFVPRQDPGRALRFWRPFWWAVEQPTGIGDGRRTVADAEVGGRTWPQPWAGDFHMTRVDIACDICIRPMKGQPMGFTTAHRELFTGRGAKQIFEKRHELRTMYIGGRESPVMLRIYKKTERCSERDKMRWLEHGWNGRDDVWRIEFEFHRKALPEGLELPRDVGALWADGLARIRMCAVNPRTFCEQNRAPTHPWWAALGQPAKLTRRAVDMAGPPREQTRAEILRALDKLAVRGGVALLDAMVSRLQRHQVVSEVGHHGKHRKGRSAP